jgi:cytosine deaminase
VARVVRGADGALGAFVHGQPEIDDGLRALFRAADRFGLPLDFHADEGLAPGLRGVERIADMALATGHQGPILCGHACALSCLAEGDLSRVTDKLARAGIAVVTLPATNLFLQDRSAAGSPRRGLAPVRALQAAGVRVVVGGDNVRDAFCPAGRHDPLWSLGLAALAAQLDGPAGCLLPMITTDAARALGRDAVTVDGAPLQALQLLPAPGTGALLCGQVPDRQRLSDLILEDAA